MEVDANMAKDAYTSAATQDAVAAVKEADATPLGVGTALFNNHGHGGQQKTAARSKSSAEMVLAANARAGADWQRFTTFTPDAQMQQEFKAFGETLAKKFPSKDRTQVSFQGLEGMVYTGDAADVTYAQDGSVLMLTAPIDDIWPQHEQEALELYELAKSMLPAHNRSKHESRVENMHSLGVKQMGMGENDTPILLKIKAHRDYAKFQRHAARYYIKQEMIEAAVAPDQCATRKAMRDELSEGSCCAVPGCEAFLHALACSVTFDYAPELHLDSPKAGTLECILFAGCEHGVFAGKHGDIEKIVPLRESTLVLVDSKRLYHAAQRSEADASASFAKA
jgi:hypothetical protein